MMKYKHAIVNCAPFSRFLCGRRKDHNHAAKIALLGEKS